MNTRSAACPSAYELADFGLGRSDNETVSAIGAHLETCDECRRTVAALSDDSFIGRLRAVSGHSAATCESQTAVNAEATPSADNSNDLLRFKESSAKPPPELTNHPDYELLKELGRGGMGVVFLARNRIMERLEVLKVVNDALMTKPQAFTRFQQEIRSAAHLNHPNIVAAYSVFRAGDLLVFCMEYIDGVNLLQLVKRHGALSVADAAFYVHQVACGLEHAHDRGMVHRDIKPGNLMLTIVDQKHRIKILDFGLARATSEKVDDQGLTTSGQMLGTPDYVAPEQTLDAQTVDIRADIYSLGCTLYYLIAGRPPFQRNSVYEILHAHHQETAQALNKIRTDIPDELAAIVAKMMAKKPDNRFQTPREVADALTPFFSAAESCAVGPEMSTAVVSPHELSPVSDCDAAQGEAADSLSLGQTAIEVKRASARGWTVRILSITAALLLTLVAASTAIVRSCTADKVPSGPVTDSEKAAHGIPPRPAGFHQMNSHARRPTVLGTAPNQRLGFAPESLQLVFDSATPHFNVPNAILGAELNITRLFLCREDYVPMQENPKVSEPRPVNLWVPVKNGPYAQASRLSTTEGSGDTFHPTRPLPDGVYCLHTGILDNSNPPPDFCCPFLISGYGIPKIEYAAAELRAGEVKLTLTVRNLGLGEFNDGFIVATIQQTRLGSRNVFKERRHIDLAPIAAKQQRQVEAIWKTADWAPGTYYFHGHICYQQLWDANKLATFDTETFEIVARDK